MPLNTTLSHEDRSFDFILCYWSQKIDLCRCGKNSYFQKFQLLYRLPSKVLKIQLQENH